MALKGVNKARPDLRISASDTAGHGASSRGVERSREKIWTPVYIKVGVWGKGDSGRSDASQPEAINKYLNK